MITFERSTAAWNGRPEDDVDHVLRGFFQSRMPNPWPAFTPPQALKSPAVIPERTTRATRWQLYNRLLLIAASVALLVGAQFLLPNFMSNSTKEKAPSAAVKADVEGATAGTQDNNKVIKDEILLEEGTTKIYIEVSPGSK